MTNGMRAQITSLPALIREALPGLEAAVRELAQPDWAGAIQRVVLVGCGDSHHAALSAELAFEALAGLPAEPLTAMQFARYTAPHMAGPGTLVVGLSVSGAVARTAEALGMARRSGAAALALTANPAGRVAQAAERVLLAALPPFPGPPGVVIPGVRTYIGNLLTLYLLAVQLGEARGALPAEAASACRAELHNLAGAAERTVAACDAPAQALVEDWADAHEFVYVGAGPNYGTALYSAAKMLEACGNSALGQDTEEWAHLQYFARTPATPTFIISAGGRDLSRAAEVAEAAAAIGRRVVAVAPAWAEGLPGPGGRSLPVALPAWQDAGRVPGRAAPAIQSAREAFSPVLTAIPGALFAAHRAAMVGEPYFRDFKGGRSASGGGGLSRIQTSAVIAGL